MSAICLAASSFSKRTTARLSESFVSSQYPPTRPGISLSIGSTSSFRKRSPSSSLRSGSIVAVTNSACMTSPSARWTIESGTTLLDQEGDADREQPQRPPDVRDGYERPGELPTVAFVRPHELERPDDEQGAQDQAGDSERGMKHLGLQDRRAHQRGPRSSEEIPKVLTDRDAEIAVERLKHHVDRFPLGLARARV